MHPELFKIGPFTVYSYGLMLGVGFILSSMALGNRLKRMKMDPGIGNTVTLLAIVFGVIGSKLLYVLENWGMFLKVPGILWSPGGLTWYGGFILATVAIWTYCRRRKIRFADICDAASPALLLGYGVARIGCHLAGDGDYGMPTDLPWAAVYSNGTYPPSIAFSGFPEIVAKYGVNGVVPDTIPVHPTPVYEFLLGLAGFILFINLAKKSRPAGWLFMAYLVYAGASRFAVEFLRLNPRFLFGLSEAQLISAILIVVGIAGMSRLSKKGEPTPGARSAGGRAVPPA
jgi:phosphatidylglycerol:prolipoprotein diacylglycerol transferase